MDPRDLCFWLDDVLEGRGIGLLLVWRIGDRIDTTLSQDRLDLQIGRATLWILF